MDEVVAVNQVHWYIRKVRCGSDIDTAVSHNARRACWRQGAAKTVVGKEDESQSTSESVPCYIATMRCRHTSDSTRSDRSCGWEVICRVHTPIEDLPGRRNRDGDMRRTILFQLELEHEGPTLEFAVCYGGRKQQATRIHPPMADQPTTSGPSGSGVNGGAYRSASDTASPNHRSLIVQSPAGSRDPSISGRSDPGLAPTNDSPPYAADTFPDGSPSGIAPQAL
jgi:hypothetical protein